MPSMAGLTRHGGDVGSVFDLLGHDENDLTAALGFTLARSPRLLRALVSRVWPAGVDEIGEASLALEVRGQVGRTDLEITVRDALVVVEAKPGWLLPTETQLASYTRRIHDRGRGLLVTLSQASDALAAATLPHRVDGVDVVHLAWRQLLADLAAAQVSCRGIERHWLDELETYLNEVIWVRSKADSWTYCVVLNEERPGDGGPFTFREFVTDEAAYFHPFGMGGWPTEPPNFLAFRWRGAVQRIHRVVQAEVVPSLLDRWSDIPATEETVRPHAVYRLGPRLPPFDPIPSGASYRASRLWVLLDQLQSSPTLAEALAASKALQPLG
jgi:hypothetical protein